MPFAGEAASAWGHEDVMKDPEVLELLKSCTYLNDPNEYIGAVLNQVLNFTHLIQEPTEGTILASDGSSYEAAIKQGFPSVRIGVVKLGQVWIRIPQYLKLDKANGTLVDPIAAARISRERISFSVPLTGAGVQIGNLTFRSTFRKTVFEAFRSQRFQVFGAPLINTLIELCKRLNRIDYDQFGRECLVLERGSKCPITSEELEESVFIPTEEGMIAAPHIPGDKLYITDILRLSEAFAEEGSNQECMTRAMNIFEHILLAHTLHQLWLNPTARAALNNLVVIMDGPLAVFGEPAVFHRPILELIHEIREKMGSKAPLVIGITKSGAIVDHGKLIQPILSKNFDKNAMLVLPISDPYRYQYIDRGPKLQGSNFGERTHYGQSFLIRTRTNKMFELNIVYPFGSKGPGFQNRKMELTSYGNAISKALSILDLLETDLYVDANIAQHLAHQCASIAHRPAGKTLETFIKGLVEPIII